MRNEIYYEWCYETVIDGEVEEVDFEEKLSNFTDNRKTDTLCLLRREGNEADGEQDRVYAYVKDGKLAACFEDGTGIEYLNFPTPQKFHKELANYLKAQTV